MNKKLYYAISALTLAASILYPCKCSAETLLYKVTMRLYVPRVYDNMQSLGYRKYQWQNITGYLTVDKNLATEEYEQAVKSEPTITASGFTNQTHKVNKVKVSYDNTEADSVMWRYIGSNKTGIFKRAGVKFSLDLDPSYNIGADEPDNTLIVDLSGQGGSEKVIKGLVTGQIGCGCKAYGHVSPTRDVSGNVRDITPLFGIFTMRLKKRMP